MWRTGNPVKGARRLGAPFRESEKPFVRSGHKLPQANFTKDSSPIPTTAASRADRQRLLPFEEIQVLRCKLENYADRQLSRDQVSVLALLGWPHV